MLQNRLLSNSIYTGIALFFIGIVPFVFNILVARYFGKELLGDINISLSFCLIITLFTTNFFGTNSNKFLSEFRGRNQLENFNIVFTTSIFGPLFVNTLVLLSLYFFWDVISTKFSLNKDFLVPMMYYIFGRTYYIVIRKIFYGTNLIVNYTFIEILTDIIILFGIFFVCQLGNPKFLIFSFTLGYSFFVFIGLIILFFRYKSITKHLRPNKNYNRKIVLRKYFKYGLITMIGNVSSAGTSYISMLFIGFYLSNSEAGIYSSVIAIISIVMFIPRLLSQVLLPEISNLYGAGEKKLLRKTILTSSLFLLLVGIIVLLPFFIFSGKILSLFGNSFINGSAILRIMIPAIFIRIISVPIVTFLYATKYVIYPNIGGIMILFSSVVAWMVLTPIYKLNGIAFGYLIGVIIGIGYQMITGLIIFKSFSKNISD